LGTSVPKGLLRTASYGLTLWGDRGHERRDLDRMG
jgi:hypothetical protein